MVGCCSAPTATIVSAVPCAQRTLGLAVVHLPRIRAPVPRPFLFCRCRFALLCLLPCALVVFAVTTARASDELRWLADDVQCDSASSTATVDEPSADQELVTVAAASLISAAAGDLRSCAQLTAASLDAPDEIAGGSPDDTFVEPLGPGSSTPPEAMSTAMAAADEAGDELWSVSTRGLPGAGCGCVADFQPSVERFVCGRGWQSSSMEEFLATDDHIRTTAIFVHGNDTDAQEAEARGRELFQEFVTCGQHAAPVRLVVWSWPSDKVLCRYRKDAQLKACRTNVEGYYLACFIDQLDLSTHVTLGGYSYGARVVTGSLHLLGGGQLEGRQLTERMHPERQPASAVLIGAAMANNWLLPGMRHERALSQVHRLTILFNPQDFVLHFYPRLWGRGGPDALGATGLVGARRLGADLAKVRQINMQPQLHRHHGWDYISESGPVMTVVRRELLAPSHAAE